LVAGKGNSLGDRRGMQEFHGLELGMFFRCDF
jgi:hypothetical protein